MTDKTVYTKIKKIATPVVKHYKEDLTVHDLNTLKDADKGDVFLWAPRESGTFLHKVKSRNASTENDARAINKVGFDWYDASKSCHPTIQWYVIELTGLRRGHVFKATPEVIENLRIKQERVRI